MRLGKQVQLGDQHPTQLRSWIPASSHSEDPKEIALFFSDVNPPSVHVFLAFIGA